jgi:hypothetical protein
MAITTSKVTYSLKPETVDRVQDLAIAWGVPKSEVIRRAIDKVGVADHVVKQKETPLEIFQRIQRTGSGLSPKVAAKWCAQIRHERQSWGSKQK